MYTEINEKMERAQEGIARLHKIDSMIKQLESEREELERKEIGLKADLAKENFDVEKLENRSIVSVFYDILGGLDKHLEKERSEALAAKLKYDQAAKDLEANKSEISKLSSERLIYIDCQNEYDLLYTRKKEKLMLENEETAEKMLELADMIDDAKTHLKEIKEAISAGEKALESLGSVQKSLDSAEGWGTWDLLGGGLLSDLAKHSHIDDAKIKAENAQQLLRQFKTELTDINITADISIQTEGFVKFADFFFDGLISDWVMQSRINESQRSVSMVKEQVSSVVRKLKHMKDQEETKIERIDAVARSLIVEA